MTCKVSAVTPRACGGCLVLTADDYEAERKLVRMEAWQQSGMFAGLAALL